MSFFTSFPKSRNLIVLLVFFGLQSLQGQAPKQPGSAQLFEDLQKLQVLGSALYIAAHPDDENTRLISYLANELKVNVAYLSLTRGDGGQNLIGTEIQELLGVLRTQELLAARRIDGGNQFFSRANDFGFSKHPDETLEIWNRDEVLSDVVWIMRNWQPDIVINRFDEDRAGKTHGHHTASAILSMEGFDLAGNPKAYTDQLKYVKPWTPERLYYNTSWWRYGREAFDKMDKSNMAQVDVGVYFPLKGTSNTEIAALSRSQHKCQGMGNVGTRGTTMEYLEFLKGPRPANKDDLFGGIDISWNRVKGGQAIGKLLAQVEKDFDFTKPWKSVEQLVKAYQMMQNLEDGYWKAVKIQETRKLIQGCLGLFAEAVANDYSGTPGDEITLNLEIIKRADAPVDFNSFEILPLGEDSVFQISLKNNEPLQIVRKVVLSDQLPYTNAYWLNEKGTLGMYQVNDQLLKGLPETPHQFAVKWNLAIYGVPISLEVPVVYKKDDSVKGEVYRPFEITPPVFANIAEKVYVFPDNAPKIVQVTLKAGKPNLGGTLQLCHGNGWKILPDSIDFKLAQKGEEQTFKFEVYPPENQDENLVSPLVRVDGRTYSKEVITIAYDHIPTQTILRPSESKVVKIDLKKGGNRIGYLMGAGDQIPQNLEQVGYQVTLLSDKDLTWETLHNFDAVIMGIRAYNTVDRLKFAQPQLMEYVKNGGTLIVQYNTTWDLATKDLAPYPLELSRDRVTVEDAEVRFLKPEHPVLNTPNKITQKDFEGWVQERGLYFPDKWDENFEAILSCNDPGEAPMDGGLLVAKYGEGYYIYTGYSWFRELPAGVPGAYRVFTNLISLGKEEKP